MHVLCQLAAQRAEEGDADGGICSQLTAWLGAGRRALLRHTAGLHREGARGLPARCADV